MKKLFLIFITYFLSIFFINQVEAWKISYPKWEQTSSMIKITTITHYEWNYKVYDNYWNLLNNFSHTLAEGSSQYHYVNKNLISWKNYYFKLKYTWWNTHWNETVAKWPNNIYHFNNSCYDNSNCGWNSYIYHPKVWYKPPYSYSWKTWNWSSCNKNCWWWIKTRIVYCKRNDWIIVGNSYCSWTKPNSEKTCNTQTCSQNWQCKTNHYNCWLWVNATNKNSIFDWWRWTCTWKAWGDSASCYEYRTHCWDWTVQNPNSWWTKEECDDSNRDSWDWCDDHCKIEYTYSWNIWNWWNCSKSCWWWNQNRNVICTRNDWLIVNDNKCSWTKPSTNQSCNTQSCCWNWIIDQWEECDYNWSSCNNCQKITNPDPFPWCSTCWWETLTRSYECSNEAWTWSTTCTDTHFCEYKTPECTISYDQNHWKEWWLNRNIPIISSVDCWTKTAPSNTSLVYNYAENYSVHWNNWWKTCNATWNTVKLDDRSPSWTVVYTTWWTRNNIYIDYSTTDYINGKHGSWIESKWVSWWWWIYTYRLDRYRTNFSNSDNWKSFSYTVNAIDYVWNYWFRNWVWTIKYDNHAPTGSISYENWWLNHSIDINISLTDKYNWNRDWSGIESFNLVEYTNWTKTNTISSSTISCSWTSQNKSCTYTKNFTDSDHGNTFSYKIENLKDSIWNTRNLNGWWNVKYDNKPPQAWDCTVIHNDEFLYANNNQEIQINCITAWWSPIIKIIADFENVNNESQNPEKSSNSNTLTTYENISKIDNFKENWNFRKYTQNIKKVCDQAWNCKSNLDSFEYYVFAWKIDTNKSEIKSSDLNKLINWTAIANWVNYPLTIILKDKYNNAISTVRYNHTNRKVNISLDYNNSLYLNQFNDSWNAISINSTNLYNWSNKINNNFWDISNSDNNNWKYILNFKSYSPTFLSWATDWRQFVKWNLNINNIKWILEDSIKLDWTSSLVENFELLDSNKNIQFKPIYNATFSWSIQKYWLIEWKVQESILNINENSNITTTNPKTYLIFDWKTEKDRLELYFNINDTKYNENNETIISTGSLESWINISIGQTNLLTLLKQKENTKLKNEFDTNFYTYIKYSLDWKEIIYPADHIGDSQNQKTKQTWLSVKWNISNKVTEFIENSKWKDLNNIWKLTKLNIKRDIEKSVFWLVKDKKVNNWNFEIKNLKKFEDNTDWAKLSNNNIIYFKWWNSTNWLVTIDSWNADNSIEIQWKKTIIIIWADLYIKNNMYYNDKNNDILWIIVLEDETWKGWNIYIDPNITNLVWSLYVSKVLIPWEIIWWNLEKNYNIYTTKKFGNQLHIFWNIFSENTIGGSKSNPKKCPYFIDKNNCNLKKAQKYDLNYLRRFTLVYEEETASLKKLYLPLDNWKVIWNWNCQKVYNNIIWENEILCDSDTKYVKAIKKIKDNSINQSVIIEYNPNFLKNIPPLFKIKLSDKTFNFEKK